MNKPTKEDILFREFVESLPDKHWSKYDLSAVRLGWDAGRKELIEKWLIKQKK